MDTAARSWSLLVYHRWREINVWSKPCTSTYVPTSCSHEETAICWDLHPGMLGDPACSKPRVIYPFVMWKLFVSTTLLVAPCLKQLAQEGVRSNSEPSSGCWFQPYEKYPLINHPKYYGKTSWLKPPTSNIWDTQITPSYLDGQFVGKWTSNDSPGRRRSSRTPPRFPNWGLARMCEEANEAAWTLQLPSWVQLSTDSTRDCFPTIHKPPGV